ncbi:MAG TPA: cytochrome c oxidase subunit 3 [Bryobacteraceae bacterium]|jgi:cytochrome c oxidase subunit 3|nr:cytochrome c oxidase subunit 3 [Bryobacteraceae bacterium]
MSRIVSGRAEKTDQVVVLPSSLEDPSKAPPGLYRIGLLAICLSIFAFFTALVIAYIWRSNLGPYAAPIQIPRTLWISTALILSSSVTFEIARRMFRSGDWRAASNLLRATASLGAGFLAAQITAWRQLISSGAFNAHNPHSTFFYLFTGLHAVHLIGGMIAMAAVLFGRRRRRELMDVVCYYWHFLGALWLALYLVLLAV